MESVNHFVIIAGGIGSRLYPISTPERPKQFLDLLGVGKTLIRLTYERFLAVDPSAVFWVVTSAEYVHFVEELVPEVPRTHILAEPEGRNTAPCIAYACWKIRKEDPSANIVVTPADAYVPDLKAFAVTLRSALDFASSSETIVTIGIHPSSPHTGYGYIHAPSAAGCDIVKVESFREKPDIDTAKAFLDAGGYLWNAGIFVWKASTIEAEFRRYAPQIAHTMDRIGQAFGKREEQEVLSELFPTCEKVSIDYAIMEKSQSVYVAPSDWEWSDLGSLQAVEAITGKPLV